MTWFTIPKTVFNAYENLGVPIVVMPIHIGLINKTYVVTTAKMKFILQEVSPIFDVTVNDDNHAVATHLESCGIAVPKAYMTDEGGLFVAVHGRIFRALRYIPGKSSHTITSLSMAESAGEVVGRFHLSMANFSYDYRSQRRHGGDYAFHRSNLVAALKNHLHHDYFALAEPLSVRMLTAIDEITTGLTTTPRHAHGDPKISNILFDDLDLAICLVDFDTLGKTGWSLEMADALRSWCNPHPEDVLDAAVDLNIAERALLGYGSVMRGFFTAQEADELIKHSQAITLCLAMRYLADVLNEHYFMHDQQRFHRAAEHNWLRAQAMHALFLDFLCKQRQIGAMVRDLVL